MPVKIRLARHGRKRYAFYHIVVADSRAPRDGRYIERIGSYNPNTNPASIDLDKEKALDWLFKGAQPTDTTRTILSRKGVLMKKHLLEGVKKGAFDEAEAERRYQKWMEEKEAKIQAEIDKLTSEKESSTKKRIEAEAKVNAARAEKIAKKSSEMAAEAEAAKAKEDAPSDEASNQDQSEESKAE
ncbi:30S ribosomal protein S16 [Marinilabiliaceae bacterium ANBcel2]|nr:30S ribosomal protein S16 [Marinilabiliaceae bacterium ANBcel2]